MPQVGGVAVDLAFKMERVTRIELALSAWETYRHAHSGRSLPGQRAPVLTFVDRTCALLMARQWHGPSGDGQGSDANSVLGDDDERTLVEVVGDDIEVRE
jgi:hypothetical protein